MSIETVREYLHGFGREQDIQEFDVSSATVELAAQALHTAPAHIAKTLSFKLHDDSVILIVPESARVYTDVSLKRFTTVFPACGSSNSAIALTCEELEAYARSLGWVDVCKNWDPALTD